MRSFYLSILLLLLIACGKEHSNKKSSSSSLPITSNIQTLKSEIRDLTTTEIDLFKNACKALMSKRANFTNHLNGKNFFFNLSSTDCAGNSKSNFNVSHQLSIILDDVFIYRLNQENYKGITGFIEEESDTRGIMQEYCSKVSTTKLQDGYTLGADSFRKISIKAASADITEISLKTYNQASPNSSQFKLSSSHDLSIQVSELRGLDVYGIVVEKKITKICKEENRSVPYENLKSEFSKF